ncbi:hypothetical protein XCCB100_0023 [Xanthomonas campestris pv. campestris]|uniref:Uncharacterized protein n=1 Tax=Xanthomonas campestris pv. campestris (strain B100) TaxID=509169 RepID=B0RLG0_XANCB|nr:hypothetical protein XCCB100_0023 [Xanthomonas campestris pv. campestris]
MSDTTARFRTRRIGCSVARLTRTCGRRYPDWSCCCAAYRSRCDAFARYAVRAFHVTQLRW